MRADPEEYVGHDVPRSRFPYFELLLALVLIAGLVVFWFWSEQKPPAQAVVEVPLTIAPVVAPEVPATPDIPQRPEPATAVVPEPAAVTPTGEIAAPTEPQAAAPLTVEQGDEVLREQLTAAGAKPILKKMLAAQQPLEVSAALIDGLGRGIILRKFLPSGLHSEAFGVMAEDDGYYMNPTGFLRYDNYADAIAALDIGVLVNTFHVLRPLYEQVYGYLGLDAGDFDNAVIRILDLVLATPEIGEPIALQPKAVVYIYADPALESLPAVQKQLLRMGPDNLRRIKQQAQLLREGLLAQ